MVIKIIIRRYQLLLDLVHQSTYTTCRLDPKSNVSITNAQKILSAKSLAFLRKTPQSMLNTTISSKTARSYHPLVNMYPTWMQIDRQMNRRGVFNPSMSPPCDHHPIIESVTTYRRRRWWYYLCYFWGRQHSLGDPGIASTRSATARAHMCEVIFFISSRKALVLSVSVPLLYLSLSSVFVAMPLIIILHTP